MRITPLVLTGALATAVLAVPADAAPRKPITKTYEATAPTPDVTNLAEGVATYSVCNQQVPQSWHLHVFTAPAPGKLKVDLSNFLGDWDLLLTDAKGTQLAAGVGMQAVPGTPAEEVATVKIKRAKTKINIISCNFSGGPTATVKYVFTYA